MPKLFRFSGSPIFLSLKGVLVFLYLWHLVQHLRHHLEHLHPVWECLGLRLSSDLDFNFSLPGKQQVVGDPGSGSLPPMQTCGLSSKHVSTTWPSCYCCRCLRNEPSNESCFCLSNEKTSVVRELQLGIMSFTSKPEF